MFEDLKNFDFSRDCYLFTINKPIRRKNSQIGFAEIKNGKIYVTYNADTKRV